MFFESVIINAIIQQCFETLRGEQAQMPRSWAVPAAIEYAVTPRALLPNDKHRAADDDSSGGAEQHRSSSSPDDARRDTPHSDNGFFGLSSAPSIAGVAKYVRHAAAEAKRRQQQPQQYAPLSQSAGFLPSTWHESLGPLRLRRVVAGR
jgi:hypothetical protein